MEDVEGEEEHVHEQPLNEQVLYDVSSDSRTHGRFAIANGAVRAADVRAAARERGLRPSNPVSLQSMAREMARLRRANARLQANHEKDNALQHYKVTTELTLVHIYEALFNFLLLIFIHTSFCIYVLVLCLQGLYRELGNEIPEDALQRLSVAQAIVSIYITFLHSTSRIHLSVQVEKY